MQYFGAVVTGDVQSLSQIKDLPFIKASSIGVITFMVNLGYGEGENMRLFRNMSKKEHINWKRGAILGFYTYMLLLLINNIYSFIYGIEPFTSIVIFWAGLIMAFGYEFFLNFRSKLKAKE